MNIIQTKLYGTLDAQSFLKIFPQQYYNKFASHLKALQFEKQLFSNPPEPGKLKFIKRIDRNSKSHQQSDDKNPSSQKKIKITKFGKINDILSNDKQQLIRFKNINKMLEKRLTNSAQGEIIKLQKQNQIKTFQQKQQTPHKIIEDMITTSKIQTQDQIKQKLQAIKRKQIICKFVKRIPEQANSKGYKSKLLQPEMKRYNSLKKISPINRNNQQEILLQSNSLKRHNQITKHKQPILKTNSLQKYNSSLNNNNQKSNQNKFQKVSSTLILKIGKQNQSLNLLNKKYQQNQQFKGHFQLLQPIQQIYESKNKLKSSRLLKTSQKLQIQNIQPTLFKKDLIYQTNRIKQLKNQFKSLVYSQEINNHWKNSQQFNNTNLHDKLLNPQNL